MEGVKKCTINEEEPEEISVCCIYLGYKCGGWNKHGGWTILKGKINVVDKFSKKDKCGFTFIREERVNSNNLTCLDAVSLGFESSRNLF